MLNVRTEPVLLAAKRRDALNRDDFIRELRTAAQNDTLLTPKHDPAGLPVPHNCFRTITCMSPAELEQYLAKGEFNIREYTNTNPAHSRQYFVLKPRDASVVPGSGVPPMSSTPTNACDRFVAVCSANQGWHLFAEKESEIKKKVQNGKLLFDAEYL